MGLRTAAAALLWVPMPNLVNIPNLASMTLEQVDKNVIGMPNGVGSPSVSAAH